MNSSQQNPHRDPNRDEKGKTEKGHIIDPENQLVYEDKHWKTMDNLDPNHVDDMKTGKSPLTKMEEGGICDGVLHLTGNTVKEHKEDILNTIKNSEEQAISLNPMNKIENIEQPDDNTIIVYTMKNQLAVTIGKKIDQSLKGGSLDIKWSKDDQPVEVKWHKD